MHYIKKTLLLVLSFIIPHYVIFASKYEQLNPNLVIGNSLSMYLQESLQLGQSLLIGDSTPIHNEIIPQEDDKFVPQKLYDRKFWISKLELPNKILTSEDEIKKFSEKILSTPDTNCIDLSKYPSILSKQQLTYEISKNSIPSSKRYIGKSEVDMSYYEQILSNKNEQSIKKVNTVKYGFIVNNTHIRAFPTNDVSYDEPNDIAFDLNCETGLKIWEPALVLHESLDKEFFFIKTYNYDGWIKVSDIALTKKDEWEYYKNYEEFLIVTDNMIHLDFNLYNPKTSQTRLTMGTKLPLVTDKPDLVDNVSTYSSHVILLPTRNDYGYLEVFQARIPFNRGTHLRYLPYTPKNVINQSFKLLGDLYGWSDLWDTRDCSSLVTTIYKTFGYNLPRNGINQAAIKTHIDVSSMDINEKKDFIMSQPVGTLLHMPGHVMIYIGKYNDEPYIIHAAYASSSQYKQQIIYNCVIVSNLNLLRSNGRTFLESINTVNCIK